MTKHELSPSWLIALITLAVLIVSLSYRPSYSQKKEDPDIAMREYMLKISRQIGVTCNYCHDIKNFKDSSMQTWKISKEHMKVVHLLNTEGFNTVRSYKADCYMCHQGKAKYQYQEPRGH